MLGLLPLISLILLGLAAYSFKSQDRSLRESFLIGFVIWGCFITGVMETLSLFNGLTLSLVLLCWSALLIGSCIIIYNHRHNLILPVQKLFNLSFSEKFFSIIILLMITYLAFLALSNPPNTIDAMTYHMSRVVHWIQDHSVAYYPTGILRQLYYPRGAEYIIFQFQLLSHSDQWANFVQTLSMIGCLFGTSLIAKELGAGRYGQILAALIAITLPIGILESTSTQTDYVACLWLCLFVYFFLRWRKSCHWFNTAWMSLCLGLSFLTKGTDIVFALPFIIWMILIIARRFTFQKLVMLAVSFIVVIALNGGMFLRNAQLSGGHALMQVSGKAFSKYTGIDSLINEHFGWEELGSNALRNTGLELSTPWGQTNKSIAQCLHQISNILHVNMDDKSSSLEGTLFEPAPSLSLFEDNAQSPLHLILFFLTIFLITIFPSLRKKELLLYLLALIGMIIAFNLILKWQPWNARFHLSIFALSAPLMATIFEKVRPRLIIILIILLLITCSLPYLFYNPMKSSGNKSYFDDVTMTQFQKIKEDLTNLQCHQMGLLAGEFVHEYPLWKAFNPRNDNRLRIEHLLIDGSLSPLSPTQYPLGEFKPCVIMSVGLNFPKGGYFFGSDRFLKVYSKGSNGDETDIFEKI